MKGFSLIELLTVVIIVGILAAVAMPQYQKAIEKSRVTEALSLGRSIVDSQNRALEGFIGVAELNSREWLDIQLPGGSWSTDTTFNTKNFSYTLQTDGVFISRSGGNISYNLRLYNNEGNGEDYCSGTICSSFAGMGLKDTAAY